jgi:hypothetical protein
MNSTLLVEVQSVFHMCIQHIALDKGEWLVPCPNLFYSSEVWVDPTAGLDLVVISKTYAVAEN